jgi:hypothetical protein
MNALRKEIAVTRQELAHTERALSNLEDYGDGFGGGYDEDRAVALQERIELLSWRLEELTDMLGE